MASSLEKRVETLTHEPIMEDRPIDEYHTPKQLLIHTGTTAEITSAAQLASVVSEDLATTAADNLHASEARILVLYTGGTIGMRKIGPVYRPEPYYLPCRIRELTHLNDKHYIDKNYADAKVKPYCLPPLRLMKKRIVYWLLEYDPLLDSCDITFDDWIRIGKDIRKAYDQYDGFVILHGTDTLAYTASALSFMLENLGKPVVITGAQIPICEVRSDGRDNLIGALIIAGGFDIPEIPICEVRSDGRDNLIGALIIAGGFDIPEVTVYFNNKLLRGNRSTKLDNNHMEAFESPNMSPIAQFGIALSVNFESIFRSSSLSAFTVHDRLCRDVSLLYIFPSMSINTVRAALQPPTQGVVIQSYGCGNMPSRRTDIIEEIRDAVQRGCIVVNCSQCLRGMVEEQYFTGKILYDVGVISGADMTIEAAMTKLMYILYDVGVISGADMTIEAAMTKLMYVIGHDEWDLTTKRKMMQHNLRGEMTITRSETLQDLEIIPRLAQFLRVSSSEEVQLLRNALFPPLLCHAARNGDVELLENLRQSGALLSAVDYNGRTPLHVAAAAGHTNVVLYLLKYGANVHARDQWGDNPLMNAVRRRNLACIKALKEADAIIVCNPIELDQWGDNPLMNAVRRRNLACIKALKEADAIIVCNPIELDQWGDNPLMNAVRRRNLACIKALKEADAIIVCNPIELGMELCLAANKGDIQTIEAWIAAGVNINETDYDGRTALHVAVASGVEEMVELLLRNGADPQLKDQFGRDSFDEAEQTNKKSPKIIELLKRKYAINEDARAAFAIG
uniref:asparaginase n=1 Tax=Ascaris lumbricoides TaxID=6252 RepID=A0A9J2Q7E8_ASCLU